MAGIEKFLFNNSLFGLHPVAAIESLPGSSSANEKNFILAKL